MRIAIISSQRPQKGFWNGIATDRWNENLLIERFWEADVHQSIDQCLIFPLKCPKRQKCNAITYEEKMLLIKQYTQFVKKHNDERHTNNPFSVLFDFILFFHRKKCIKDEKNSFSYLHIHVLWKKDEVTTTRTQCYRKMLLIFFIFTGKRDYLIIYLWCLFYMNAFCFFFHQVAWYTKLQAEMQIVRSFSIINSIYLHL